MKITPMFRARSAWVAVCLGFSLRAIAAGERAEIHLLRSLVVTGSNLPSAGETPSAPVTVVSAADLARTGVSGDLLETIRKLAPQFSGGGNLGNANGNLHAGRTNGGSALALRNLQTLVLINGRRMAVAPAAANGGGVFVDLNAIPVSAVERVEILTDGASAIHGADAVSGVVNVILKTDFNGGELGGRYAWSRNTGYYAERSAWGVAGGRMGEQGPQVTASYEWTKTDPIHSYERPFATPSYGTTSFAGAIQLGAYDPGGSFIGDPNGYYHLDPALTAPRAGATLVEQGYIGPFDGGAISRTFDLARHTTMLIGEEKKIFTVSGDHAFSENVAVFGDVILARTATRSQLNAQPLSVAMGAADPNNPVGRDVSVRNRFVGYPRLYVADTEAFRGVLGIRGAAAENWTWETAVSHGRGAQAFANVNLIRTAARMAAVGSGAIDLFSREQPRAAVETMLGSAEGRFTSRQSGWDLKVVGSDVWAGPGGGIDLVVGGEWREEGLLARSHPDSQSATFAYDVGATIDPFDKVRRVTAAFAELKVPLAGPENRRAGWHAADLTLAVRHERYDDTGDPTVPKITLRYQPFGDTWLVRASYAQSFAAPSLYALNSPTGTGYTGVLTEFGSNQAQLLLLPAEPLKPSRSTSRSAGMVWTPGRNAGWSVSLDYFNIEQRDVVSSLNAPGVLDQVFHSVEVKGGASRYASLIRHGSFTGPAMTRPGQISALGLDNLYFVIPAASNLGTQKLDGFDLQVTAEIPVGAGRLRWGNTTTYYRGFDLQVAPEEPFTPTAGLVTGLNGTIPRWRSYNVLTWSQADWSVDVGHTFYASLRDATWRPAFAPMYEQRIPSYSVFDARVTYRWPVARRRGVDREITMGVNNVGNRMPARAATFDGLSNADVSEFNPIGRMFFVAAKVRF